ncbi:MAG: DNA starvation/stationary phase protection protein Dps [Phototrophicaceae bacterium]
MATKTTTRFKTRIDIPENTRVQLIELLNQHLADLFDLYSQTKQAHWNVRGIHFMQLHELFDELAGQLPEFTDMVAERANSLGGYAMGTARMSAENSRLPEFPTDVVDGTEMVEVLADRWATYAASARDAIAKAEELEDIDTSDLFTGISRAVDKSLWFIEAHLQ